MRERLCAYSCLRPENHKEVSIALLSISAKHDARSGQLPCLPTSTAASVVLDAPLTMLATATCL